MGERGTRDKGDHLLSETGTETKKRKEKLEGKRKHGKER